MNKKHILTAIGIFLATSIYGGTLNFCLQGNRPSIGWSIFLGFMVGMVSMLSYFLHILCCGIRVADDRNLDLVDRGCIKLMNLMTPVLIFCGISYFITEIFKLVILQSYAWIYLVNFLIAIVITVIANYDAKSIRNRKRRKY